MNIYVGNLPSGIKNDDLQKVFEEYGRVESVKIITDKYTGEPRGFAFVEMPTKEEALSAMTGLNGKDLQGRTITVNEARPRTEGRNRDKQGGRKRSW